MSDQETSPSTSPSTLKSIADLAEAVDAMTAEANMLRHEVRVIEEKSLQDRKILRVMMGLLIAKLITLALLVLVLVGLSSSTNLVKDCISPKGQCAQRQARQTAVVVLSITHRTEAQRLQSEINVAKAKGDTVAVDERERLLKVIQAQIEQDDAMVHGNSTVSPTTPSAP
jgi:hypothetical protein